MNIHDTDPILLRRIREDVDDRLSLLTPRGVFAALLEGVRNTGHVKIGVVGAYQGARRGGPGMQFIPEYHYHRFLMEGFLWSELVEMQVLPDRHSALISDVQRAHDSTLANPSGFLLAMWYVARKHGLDEATARGAKESKRLGNAQDNLQIVDQWARQVQKACKPLTLLVNDCDTTGVVFTVTAEMVTDKNRRSASQLIRRLLPRYTKIGKSRIAASTISTAQVGCTITWTLRVAVTKW